MKVSASLNKTFYAIALCLAIIHISICDLFFQGTMLWSYLTLACELAFLIILFQFVIVSKKLLSIEKISIFNFIFLLLISICYNLPYSNLFTLIGRAIEICIILMLFHLNKNSLTYLMVVAAITLSICVYGNLYMVLLFPEGIPDYSGERYFLLGSNYNQIGPKILLAIIMNIIILGKSPLTWFNLFLVSSAGIFSLYIVGSMTSLISIIIFICTIVLSIYTGLKTKRFLLFSTLAFIFSFEVLVVFWGSSMSNSQTSEFLDFIGKDLTFTGRTFLWNYSGDYFMDSPFWGHGFVAPIDYAKSGFFHGIAKNCHNYIYNILHKGGIILIITMIVLFKKGYNRIKKYIKYEKAFCIVMATNVYLIMSMFEAFDSFYIFILITLMFYYPNFSFKLTSNGNSVSHYPNI